MCKGVTIRGEEIKAHAKKKREADSSNEEEPGDDDGGGSIRRGAGKSEGRDSKSGKAGAKKWFVGCYGCGGDHMWTCHAVGPIGRKETCTRCGKKGHNAKVCTEAAAARAALIRNYGKPGEFEQYLPDNDEGQPDRDPSPERWGAGDRDRGRDRQHRGRGKEKAHSKGTRSRGRARSGSRDRSGDRSRHKRRDRRRDPSRDRRKKRSRSRSRSRSRQKNRDPKRSMGRDKTRSRSRSGSREYRSATGDSDAWRTYEPQRIPPAHAPQWQGLPLPP